MPGKMKKRATSVLLALGMLLSAAGTGALAAGEGQLPQSIVAEKDAYIQKNNAGPFAANNINIKNADAVAYNRRGLIAFPTGGQGAAVEQAEKITLRLHVASRDSSSKAGVAATGEATERYLRIYGVHADWAETVQWNNAPNYETAPTPPVVVNDTLLVNRDIPANTAVEFDVTSYVKGLAPGADLGLLLVIQTASKSDFDNSGVVFYSREATNESYRPTLVLEYPVTAVAAVTVETPAEVVPVLPGTVTVTTADGKTAERAVVWESIDPAKYAREGSFDVKGTVSGTDLQATARITVTALPPAVTAVELFPAITVKTGTPVSAISLPKLVSVTLDNDSTVPVPVTWVSQSAYDPAREGTYAFVGTLGNLDGTIRNPDSIKAEIDVLVRLLPDKNILAYALSAARQAMKPGGAYERLTPSYRAKFDAAVTEGEAVNHKSGASLEEIQAAYLKLQTALWNLSYTKAEKTALQAAVDRAAGMEDTAAKAAVDTAKALLNNEELTVADQAAVDAAVRALNNAISSAGNGGSGGNGGTENPPAKPEEPKPGEKTPVSERFDDVAPSAWYVPYVQDVVDQGLMQGTIGGFAPEADTSRAMLMTVLYRMAGEPAQSGADPKVWYAAAMTWAKELGISDGSSPDGRITREQIALMLYRYAKAEPKGTDLSHFSDADKVSVWGQDAMRWAVETGLINGKSGGRLDPQGAATRAEVAAMLSRFVKMNENG